MSQHAVGKKHPLSPFLFMEVPLKEFAKKKVLLFISFSQAAKTVKYGSSVDGISTAEPEQYAKR